MYEEQSETTNNQDTQFLLKRIDPSESNEALRRNLMGEIKENKEWVRYGEPTVRDKKLLGQIIGMVERYVNPEIRLADISHDKAMEFAEAFHIQLNDLLFQKGYEEVEEPVDKNMTNKQLQTKIDPQYHLQLVDSLSSYIYGNLTRAVTGNEAKLIGKIVRISETMSAPEKRSGFMGLFNKNQQ